MEYLQVLQDAIANWEFYLKAEGQLELSHTLHVAPDVRFAHPRVRR